MKDQTNKKRGAEEQLDSGDSPAPKQFKPNAEPDREKAEDGDDDDADCCVVCALPLRVFKEDNAKEVHHYLR